MLCHEQFLFKKLINDTFLQYFLLGGILGVMPPSWIDACTEYTWSMKNSRDFQPLSDYVSHTTGYVEY